MPDTRVRRAAVDERIAVGQMVSPIRDASLMGVVLELRESRQGRAICLWREEPTQIEHWTRLVRMVWPSTAEIEAAGLGHVVRQPSPADTGRAS